MCRLMVLPEVMFVPDLALDLGTREQAARRALLRGECGPYLQIGRRLAVPRDPFLSSLAQREQPPNGPTRSNSESWGAGKDGTTEMNREF